jgi:ketosteroid isomerase-like protein
MGGRVHEHRSWTTTSPARRWTRRHAHSKIRETGWRLPQLWPSRGTANSQPLFGCSTTIICTRKCRILNVGNVKLQRPCQWLPLLAPHPRTHAHIHGSTGAHCRPQHRRSRSLPYFLGCPLQLDVLITLMLARERLAQTRSGNTPLAAALAALPSRPLEMVADAMTALGCADVVWMVPRESGNAGSDHHLATA